MYSEFAYSGTMQIILTVVVYITSFIHMYLVANLILKIYGEESSIKRKALFAFLTGPILYQTWNYAFYIIWNMRDFTYLENLLLGNENPLIALLYCYLGIWIFKLAKHRAIELMGHMFLYSTIEHVINRFISAVWFPQMLQTTQQYNYALDAVRMGLHTVIIYIIYRIAIALLNRNPKLLISQASTIPRPKTDLAVYLFKACFIYAVSVALPLFIPDMVFANALVLLVLVMLFILTLYQAISRHYRADIARKELHISSLIKTNHEFNSLKHDFYNILQTYSGYLALGDLDACKKYHASLVDITVQAGDSLDLSARVAENPALIALLLEKHELAKQQHVQMNVALECSVSDLSISDIDLCRVVACLLDNAIEAATESEQRRVAFTAEQHDSDKKLFIISNSTQQPPDVKQMFALGTTSKEGHEGVGLNNVKRIIEKYLNCSFKLNYYNKEMTAYIEIC